MRVLRRIFLFFASLERSWEGFKRQDRQEREGEAKGVRVGRFGPAGEFQRGACLVDRFSILYMVVLVRFFGGRFALDGSREEFFRFFVLRRVRGPFFVGGRIFCRFPLSLFAPRQAVRDFSPSSGVTIA